MIILRLQVLNNLRNMALFTGKCVSSVLCVPGDRNRVNRTPHGFPLLLLEDLLPLLHVLLVGIRVVFLFVQVNSVFACFLS